MKKLKNFKILGDKRGQLIALEENKEVPFDIKRVFYIYGTQEGISRGQHAHYKTKQLLIAVNGSCEIILDNGNEKNKFILDKPNIGLIQDTLTWGTMNNFSKDCVLMVLCNDYYNEEDYIRDYEQFLKEIK